jgi:hypothetical protein
MVTASSTYHNVCICFGENYTQFWIETNNLWHNKGQTSYSSPYIIIIIIIIIISDHIKDEMGGTYIVDMHVKFQ